MVCYNSMSPLPSSTSMLCSASASFCFYALLCFLLCSTPPVVQLLFFLLCSVLPLHALHLPLISPSGYALCLILPTCITFEKNSLSSLFCMSFSHSSPLPDHHSNSSSSLVVILNLFIISGRYPKILWLLWQSQLFVFSVSYNQSFLASLASKPLPSRDHRR
jgi:hypothetical protein